MLRILDSDSVNLVVVAGYNDVSKSNEREEIAEIEKMHDLMKQYNLNGRFRWMSAQMNRHVVVNFTATLLIYKEHLCNLLSMKHVALQLWRRRPTFVAGPYHPNQEGELMSDFFECCKREPSHLGLDLLCGGFSGFYYRNTWKIYSERLMTLAGSMSQNFKGMRPGCT